MSVHHATWDRTGTTVADISGGAAVTILLVEDDDTVRKLVARLLTLHGYRVLTAESGTRAVSLWRQHRAEIDLLLTDVVLPDGPGARDLASQFQAEKPNLKVVFTSGYALGFSDEDECVATEVNFVHKPYHPEQLLAVLRNALESDPCPSTVC